MRVETIGSPNWVVAEAVSGMCPVVRLSTVSGGEKRGLRRSFMRILTVRSRQLRNAKRGGGGDKALASVVWSIANDVGFHTGGYSRLRVRMAVVQNGVVKQ